MNETVFRGWRLAFDSAATARAYEAARPVGPELCGCKGCRNFIVARERAYPEDLKAFAATVGIQPLTETEVIHVGPVSAASQAVHLYGGFFHFVGHILMDPGGPAEEVYFMALRHLLPESFGSAPVVQAEFHLHAPWLLDEPPD